MITVKGKEMLFSYILIHDNSFFPPAHMYQLMNAVLVSLLHIIIFVLHSTTV